MKKPSSNRAFPFLRVSARTHFQLGLELGQAQAGAIQASLAERRPWFDKLKSFAERDPAARLDPFLRAAEKHFPRLVEELRGLARGAGIPFRDLLILNLNPELSAMRRDPSPAAYDCSSIIYRGQDRVLLGHNEDGANANRGRLLVLEAHPPSAPAFLALVYPGILPGNGPGLNAAGIIHSCNYIATRAWRPGVPRYFLDRAVLEATSLEAALATVAHPARAYSQHHNLISLEEKRALGVEVAPTRFSVQEVEGFYTHANHLVHPSLLDLAQPERYLRNSAPRQRVLEEKVKGLPAGKVQPEDLLRILQSHAGRPHCPCRHPSWSSASTLATALFDGRSRSFRLFKHNPCAKNFRRYRLPA